MTTDQPDSSESVDEILDTLVTEYMAFETPDVIEKAKAALQAYITRECARKVLEGQIKELEQLPLARLDEPDAHKSKKYRDAGKFITVVYAPKRLAELRAALKEVGGGE